MVVRRFLIRGTRGSGPPAALAFRELSYSDSDGLLYVGRPDGTARSFGESGTATTTARTVGGKVRVLALGGFRK